MFLIQENLAKIQGDLPAWGRIPRAGSQSAPIFPDKKFDPAEKIRDMQPSTTRKFHTYVLPTPVDARGTIPPGSSNPVPGAKQGSMSGRTHHLWYSSPLEPNKHVKDSREHQSADLTHTLKEQSVLKESNSASIRGPPPLSEGLSLQQLDTVSDTKKIKRHAFSGPLTSKAWSGKPKLSASGPISSMEHPQLVSAMLLRVPLHQSTSPPKVSPSASPPLMSSPKISELHELPRPPVSSALPTRTGLVGHSAPLVSRSQELSTTTKMPLMTAHAASPLPMPPGTVPRSFSIPSSSQRAMTLSLNRLMETQNPELADIASPPLTPISLTNIPPVSTASEVVTRPGNTKG